MEQLLQSLNVMLLGMCGIFIVMSVLSLAIALLNRMFKNKMKKRLPQAAAFVFARPGKTFRNILAQASISGGNNGEIGRAHFTNRQIFGIVIKESSWFAALRPRGAARAPQGGKQRKTEETKP